jgi:hypothetical protein
VSDLTIALVAYFAPSAFILTALLLRMLAGFVAGVARAPAVDQAAPTVN